jgi:hypothetical protein
MKKKQKDKSYSIGIAKYIYSLWVSSKFNHKSFVDEWNEWTKSKPDAENIEKYKVFLT